MPENPRGHSAVATRVWKETQKLLDLSDEDMEKFKADPRNADILSKVPELMTKTFVAEVVHSQGCAGELRQGDKIYFDSSGNLLPKKSPSRICIYALSALAPLIYSASELIYAGADPNQMRFKRAGCIDVGLACGGWGKVVLELSVRDRK